MKNLSSIAIATASLLAAGAASAQNGNMMNGGRWGIRVDGWLRWHMDANLAGRRHCRCRGMDPRSRAANDAIAELPMYRISLAVRGVNQPNPGVCHDPFSISSHLPLSSPAPPC